MTWREIFNGFEVCDCPECARSYSDKKFAEALKRAGVPDDTPGFILMERVGTQC